MAILRRRIGGIRGGQILNSFLKTLLASGVMAVAIWGTDTVLMSLFLKLNLHGHLEAALMVGGAMIVGIAVFFLTALGLKMEELETVLRRFRRGQK